MRKPGIPNAYLSAKQFIQKMRKESLATLRIEAANYKWMAQWPDCPYSDFNFRRHLLVKALIKNYETCHRHTRLVKRHNDGVLILRDKL